MPNPSAFYTPKILFKSNQIFDNKIRNNEKKIDTEIFKYSGNILGIRIHHF